MSSCSETTDVSSVRTHLEVNASHLGISIHTSRNKGGDAWVLSSRGVSGRLRRVLAQDHRNGSYSVTMERRDATDVRLQLWWSASDPDYLTSRWIQRRDAPTLAAKSFGCTCADCCCSVRCVAAQVARWSVEPADDSPADSRIQTTLFEGMSRSNVLVIGDSVSNGFVLDMCRRHTPCGVSNVRGARDARITSHPVTALPPRRGLENLVRRLHQWSRIITSQPNGSIVVLQSGIHDVSHPLRPFRRLPMASYAEHLSSVDRWIRNVTRVRPDLRFVWRYTTHSLLMDHDTDADSDDVCRRRAYPTTHPGVVRMLNAYAREALSGSTQMWTDPEEMTFNAPLSAFSDVVHHDTCGAGSDRVGIDRSAGSRCALATIGGSGSSRRSSRRYDGELSDRISSTFIDSGNSLTRHILR